MFCPERESNVSRREIHGMLKIPIEVIERLTNVTDLHLYFRSEQKVAFSVKKQSRLDSKPTVSSKTSKDFSLVRIIMIFEHKDLSATSLDATDAIYSFFE